MGSKTLELQEDTADERPDLDPVTRLQEINQKLNALGESSVFRRHITSRIKQ